MEFIGRKSELKTLHREYAQQDSFVVIYGRRRIGKTTLIKKFIKSKNAFYFLATQEIESQAKKRFQNIIGRKTNNKLLSKATFSDWADIFQLITEYEPEEKKIIVIDEFPYLVKSNPAFPSILQYIWDEILKGSNIMLILCGSLISMMQKYALSYDSPLYGRRTAQIRLFPLSFTEIHAVSNRSFTDEVEHYAITGGVPKYMEFFDSNDDLHTKLSNIIFSRNGFLYEEPNFLLKDEVMSPINYYSIIKVIADGNHKIGNIADAIEMKSTSIMPYLSVLMDLGFIEKRTPITEDKPEKSRKGLYFLSDNFLKFWFRYVYPFKGELEFGNDDIVFNDMKKTFISNFVAFCYEDICKDIFLNLCQKNIIDFVPAKIGSYWLNERNKSNTEIDVIAVDNVNKQVFFGECKYHNKAVEAAVAHNLIEKVHKNSELTKKYAGFRFMFGLFSKSGFTDKCIELTKNRNEILLINEDVLL